MNLQELESIARVPEPAGIVSPKMFPLRPVELKALPPGPQWVSNVLDSKGHVIDRYEDQEGRASLMITSRDHPVVTQEEINEAEEWYWSFVGVKGG